MGKNNSNSWFLQVVFILISRFFMPRYDARLQILKYQLQMLRDRIDDPRIITEEFERAELMRLGALIDHDISDVMLVVKPKTYKGWLRKKSGKKPKRNGINPVPDKAYKNPDSTWSRFIASHIETLVAIDFFTKPVLTWKGKVVAYVLVFIHLNSRKVFMTPATFHPDEKWVLQQARNASIWMDEVGVEAKHLIRDGKFAASFDAFWECSGTEIVKTPPRTPQANGYAESYISTIKAQCGRPGWTEMRTSLN